jgi:hypothetical protein
MLEQAVIDAQALKEAAITNAEQQVIEKYSGEIKEAVDSLLEAPFDDDPFADPGEEEIDRDEVVDQIPMKALDGEEACECPESEEPIELDLDQLQALADQETGEETEEEMMFEATSEEILNLLSETEEELVEEEKEEIVDEEIELDEEALKDAIKEMLTVDLAVEARGDLGTTHPTKAQQVYAVEAAAAALADTEKAEENKKFKQMVADLQEQVKSLKNKNQKILKEYRELKSVALDVSKKFEGINLSNAKLVYKNRVLESHSLNERQKENLVESISKAKSIDETKVIFETLQNSISTNSKGHAPGNLREAMSKNSRLVLKSNSNSKNKQADSSVSDRMKKLAGII